MLLEYSRLLRPAPHIIHTLKTRTFFHFSSHQYTWHTYTPPKHTSGSILRGMGHKSLLHVQTRSRDRRVTRSFGCCQRLSNKYASLSSFPFMQSSTLSRTSSVASISSDDAARRTRKRFTSVQLMMLEQLFHQTSHPTREEREAVAQAAGMYVHISPPHRTSLTHTAGR